MSRKTYVDLLCETSELIGEATQADEAIFTSNVNDRATLQPLLSELRVRYTVLLAKLDSVYDQLLQSQKRLLIKRLLESCLGRLLEIKHELVEFHLSDFTYDDDEITVTPEEAEPRIPQYFIRERAEEIENKNRFIAEILKRLGHEPPKIQPLILTEQQAVLIIQAHERARQGRLRGQFMKEIRLLKEKGRGEKGEMSAAAATAIQRVWRGFIARRETKRRKWRETLLIGMELPPYAESKTMKRAEEVKEYRRGLQTKREQEYLETLESIEDSVRTGTDSELSKSSPVSSKESKKSKEKEKKNNKNNETKTKDEEENMEVFQCSSSAFYKKLSQPTKSTFEDIWKFKDEKENAKEKCYEDMIERDKMIKIEGEVRVVVDEVKEVSSNYYKLLMIKIVLTKVKSEETAEKVRRGGKKSKKKKEKDLTPDRTTESLFEELVTNGIIRPYPSMSIDDYIGEKCYIGAELRKQEAEPSPCLGDVRQLIKEYCVLPLGAEYVRANSPLVRSVLLTGICPEDRVIFIGTSRCPWDAEQKLLFQCYGKVILIPRADYGSLSLMWRSTLHRAGALSPRLDVSCLSRVSDSYTIGTLLSALDAVLTTKRRLQLRVRALTAQEVAVQLSTRDPVYAEQVRSASACVAFDTERTISTYFYH
ncbi:Dynein regulatory complex protein 11 [Eumeta japonica]|uniref:Dynein regulatory complex protein 11 n=1 Tax=Eumeta variegata TaxID=151549 RepID=A0A4C2A0E9_EUMVA|nr:Dynein regulatory complex protein 11 [Eumeta japonica]